MHRKQIVEGNRRLKKKQKDRSLINAREGGNTCSELSKPKL